MARPLPLPLFLALCLVACSGDPVASGDVDVTSDTPTDASADAEVDTPPDADRDGTPSDAGADTELDADAPTDVPREVAPDADPDADADADAEVGCATSSDCDEGQSCEEGECVDVGCRDDDACSEESPRCDVESSVCVECLEAGDCADGFECEEFACVPGCETSDDCTAGERCVDAICAPLCATDLDCADGSHCADFLCVPDCSASSECADGEACGDGRCVPACASADECDDGQACVVDVCRDTCEEALECGLGFDCVDDACIAVDLVCHPDETWCDEGLVVRCEEDGLAALTLDCPGDQTCVELAGVGECVSAGCADGTSGCFDAVTAWTCAEDGSGRVAEPCEPGDLCDDGTCRPPSDAPCLRSWEEELDFGRLAPGSSRVRRNWVENCGEVAVPMPEFGVDGVGFELVTLPEASAILPGEAHHMMLRLTASIDGEASGLLTIDAPGLDPLAVALFGLSEEGVASCPVPIAGCRNADGADDPFVNALTAPLGVPIECDGSASEPEGEIEGFLWNLDSPDEAFGFVPLSGRELTDFFPRTTGPHVVELDVIDEEDQFSCEPARVLVVIEE